MSPGQKTALKDIAIWLFGALVAVLGYFAAELRGDVRAMEQQVKVQAIRDGTQDSTLGALQGDIRYIRQTVNEIRGILKDE